MYKIAEWTKLRFKLMNLKIELKYLVKIWSHGHRMRNMKEQIEDKYRSANIHLKISVSQPQGKQERNTKNVSKQTHIFIFKGNINRWLWIMRSYESYKHLNEISGFQTKRY